MQSTVIPGRNILHQEYKELEAKFSDRSQSDFFFFSPLWILCHFSHFERSPSTMSTISILKLESAEVWFQNPNTGEDTGLSRSILNFGKDSNHGYMTGTFSVLPCYHFICVIYRPICNHRIQGEFSMDTLLVGWNHPFGFCIPIGFVMGLIVAQHKPKSLIKAITQNYA